MGRPREIDLTSCRQARLPRHPSLGHRPRTTAYTTDRYASSTVAEVLPSCLVVSRSTESMSTLATPTSSSSASRPSPLRSSSPPATPASNPRTTTTTTTSQSSIPQMSRSASSVAITQKVPITVESALAAADGDPLAALEAVVAQRNKLLEENGQPNSDAAILIPSTDTD